MKPIYYLLASIGLLAGNAWAQATGGSCVNSTPFCSSTNYSFPNSTGSSAPSGPNYGCLLSQPNPIWYHMRIGTSGPMQLSLAQHNAAGTGIDIDFAMWGPFSSIADGCNQIFNNRVAPLQCSFSSFVTETVGIGYAGGYNSGASTPPNAVAGQFYILLLTNYSQQAGTISLSQSGGTGRTDCAIVPLSTELVQFTAEHKTTENHISWINFVENNVDYYEVERSQDGENWDALGKTYAQNVAYAEYASVDNSFERGTNYYRLRKVDVDGNHQFSEIKMVENSTRFKHVTEVVNLLGQQVSMHEQGVKIVRYEDGTSVKLFVE